MLWRGFQKPKRLAVDSETLTNNYGKFSAQPFERGFGTTIGNALRRTLLSSIEGAAVTAVKHRGRAARVPVDHRRRRGCDRHHPQPEADSLQAQRRRPQGPVPARRPAGRRHLGHDRGRLRRRDPRPGRLHLHRLRRRHASTWRCASSAAVATSRPTRTSTPTSASASSRSTAFTRLSAR